jgi:hypothetical protein
MLNVQRLLNICAAAFLAAALTVSAAGCGAALSLLPKVIGGVTEAMLIVDSIESFVDDFFASNPDPQKEAIAQRSIDTARAALTTALRTAHGAENLSKAEADAAFDDFAVAYVELVRTLQGLGVRLKVGEPGKMAAEPGVLVVPEPLAIQGRF